MERKKNPKVDDNNDYNHEDRILFDSMIDYLEDIHLGYELVPGEYILVFIYIILNNRKQGDQMYY
jgi:hypothetical protein